MKHKILPNLEYLQTILEYNPINGAFTWKKNKGCIQKHDKNAGCKTHKNYIYLTIDGESYGAHRIAWYMMTGNDPLDDTVDHRNLNKKDNRFCNLRLATQNNQQHNRSIFCNNTSGYKGVSWCKRTKKWQTSIMINNKRKHLGYYISPIRAAFVYRNAAKELHKEFRRF